MTRRALDYLTLTDVLYTQTADLTEWHARVLDSAHATLGENRGPCGFHWIREHESGRQIERFLFHHEEDLSARAIAGIGLLDDQSYRRFYYPRQPVVFVSALLAPTVPAPLLGMLQDYLQRLGAHDVLGLLVHPAPQVAGVLFVSWQGESVLEKGVSRNLHRVRLHVEAALRLQLRGAFPPAAVLSPTGKLEHLASRERADDVAALAERVSGIERARSQRMRTDQDRALAAWRALVEGRWSVVQHVDTDRKRQYLVFENAPHARRFRSLTARESGIVDQAARGRSGKQIAYALGLSEAQVSEGLGTAARKLGFRSRAALLRVAAALQHLPTRAAPATLTAAEREVLELIQLGHSNETIAALRGRSQATIANQVASILQKTSVEGRRALLSLVFAD